MRSKMAIPLLVMLLLPVVMAGSELFRALEDELDRNISKLQIEKQDSPYYISYRVEDWEYLKIEASFGGLVYSTRRKNRELIVDVHIGGYDFDNSNFIFQPSGSRIIATETTSLPIETDYDALRNDIWLVTDGTYKRALEQFSRKKATIQNQQIKERMSDFSRVALCGTME